MTKRYVALARVSSREQEREGFSLEVQEEGLRRYADHQDGEIVKFFRIAETASKSSERRTFRELIEYAKKNAKRLDGLLFYKVDRAARNLFDYVELERLESESGLQFISVSQPTENTPAGRMQRRMLASMASFYTEQQSVDVKEGLLRRVHSGLFVGMAPYGYRNVRIDGRSKVEVDPENGPKVRKIFDWFAYDSLSLDELLEKLDQHGVWYKSGRRRFPRSKLYDILRDRAYIGEVKHKGQWHPGVHDLLVDRTTFRRVQLKLGEKVYNNHELTYGSDLIKCGHCGRPIAGELKTKKSKKGVRQYIYYRCSRYNAKDQVRKILEDAVRLEVYVPREYVFFDLAVRGFKKHRAGLDGLREVLKAKKVGTLLLFGTNRLFRKVYRTLEFVDQVHKGWGIRCVFVKSGVDTEDQKRWEMILHAQSMIDQFVVTMYVDNIRAAHEGLLEKRFVFGTLSFGYRGEPIEGGLTARASPRCRIVLDDVSSKIARQVFSWYVQDGISVNEIIQLYSDNYFSR